MFKQLASLFSQFFDRGKTVEELAERVGVTVEDLENVDRSYREFTIAKKSGKRRRLHAPNDNLKSLQRKILHRLLKKLRTHRLATGFQAGVSFVDNARCHQSQAVVIRIDLVDFFPSIGRLGIERYFRKIGWNRKAACLLCDLTTHEDRLPQGAPTSPKLSNLFCYLLDVRIAQLCAHHDAVYTRYADDITISSSRNSFDVHYILKQVTAIIRDNGFQPHFGKKFDVRRPHQRQVVTGLVVNDRANLPRETRRWLRSVEHRFRLAQQGGYVGPPPSLTEEQILGWRSLRKMIDAAIDD
jgi:RNA-directed DNA polymerase